MVGLGAQFAALVRILAEYFRLGGLHGQQLDLLQVDPWIESALLTAVLLAAAGALFAQQSASPFGCSCGVNPPGRPPQRVAFLLAPYRRYTMATNQG